MDSRVSWQDEENSVAPLTESQLDLLYDISLYVNDTYHPESDEDDGNEEDNEPIEFDVDNIETSQDFFKWYVALEDELHNSKNTTTSKYFDTLTAQKDNLTQLLDKVDAAKVEMDNISSEYQQISSKTNLLNEMSEHLYLDISKLQSLNDNINDRLYYYSAVMQVSQALSVSSLSMSSTSFFDTVKKIDSSIEYMLEHNNYKESYTHLLKYRQILYNVMFMVKNYVKQVFVNATKQALPASNEAEVSVDSVLNSEIAFSLYYGKFQTSATKLKPILEQIEMRADDNQEYAALLFECQQFYFSQRDELMNNAIANSMRQLVTTHKGDNCALFRSACTFMRHICQDETQLYSHFFKNSSPKLFTYLDQLCVHLYDNLRAKIIFIYHLETLAELCGILRGEIGIETEADNNSFTRCLWALLQDVQERLVYRTHVYLQSDLLEYRPSAGDLAYPEKLQMMESIALSQMEDYKSNTGSSPADLHGMWYPTVKRTLVCLSRLYRCVDRPIFQGLSQEALTICVKTIVSASNMISSKKTLIDGQLFLIKHLLILREQIAPFQVDFTVKEMSLDFSKVKTAAFSLLQKRKQLFALNSNNALLEFLLEGTPTVKEQLLDSRKEVDKELKHSCEQFIKHCTNILIGPISSFIEKTDQNGDVKQEFNPEKVSAAVRDVQVIIKSHLSGIQRSMQLYLANKETEFILFKLIRNNIVSAFGELEQKLSVSGLSPEQLLVIACPTAEQISVLLSSASLISSTAHSTETLQTSQSPH